MCILAAVDRERILRFVIAAFILVMVAALIYEAFDIHDTKPFYTDPECLLMLHSCVLIFCIGIMALRHVFKFRFSLSELLPVVILGLSHCTMFRSGTFEVERLLFSPPLSVTSLRIWYSLSISGLGAAVYLLATFSELDRREYL